MSFKITTNVYDRCGNTHATDVYVEYAPQDADISRAYSDNKILVRPTFWKNEATSEVVDENGNHKASTIQPVLALTGDDAYKAIGIMQKTLNETELTEFNTTPGAVASIYGWFFAWLKEIYGESNVIDLGE